MSVSYVLSTSMFTEGEQREFDAPYEHIVFDSYDDACAAVDMLVTTFRSVLDYLVRVDGSDGVSVDIAPQNHAVMLAAEVAPGRPVTMWHGKECHDNGCPLSQGAATGPARDGRPPRGAQRERGPAANGSAAGPRTYACPPCA